ncbi:DUF3108 domain-containing protein [Alteromonas sp. ASW11-130]|uniref:DUF3108 domain-containing protein n=1 Tax=Alteromonas sp. ASW11-130 TaxID=3015775 RepID=UPI002242BC14|nr:DUF3108 domain-containing protein [Alteromonas sp. ASW11-130]MCW8092430.1 DUF3108 domain-containing protein [Alteromonas sp. ASW11-130]
MNPLKSFQHAIVCSTVIVSMFLAGFVFATLPQLVPFKAEYIAYKWGDDIGKAELKLEKLSKNQYSLTYSSDVSKFFLSDKRYEHSIFTVRNNHLVPHQYYFSRTGTGADKKLKLKFVEKPERQILVNESTSQDWHKELDNQLYRIDLPRQLAAGKESLSYDFINYRAEIRNYQIDVVDKETLVLPYGKLDTIKVQIIRQSSSRETYAWFAPALDYNLVRLQQFKDNDEQGDIKLVSYTPIN